VFNFTPNQIFANAGDFVGKEIQVGAERLRKRSAHQYSEYWFYPHNYSVACAQFKEPCIPIEDTGNSNNKPGFWSRF
jgi:hypothetical protein